MSTANTSIEWTDATWSPTRGCSRVSAGCQRCYAERQARRFAGPGGAYEGLLHANGSWNGKITLVEEAITQPLHWVKGRRIFVDSMSDLFHENIPFEFIAKVFAVMACTTRHTYQVLTKRPERALEFLAWLRWSEEFEWQDINTQLQGLPDQIEPTKVWPQWIAQKGNRGGYDNCGPLFPLVNLEFGVSVEDQETANQRIPMLLQFPAAVRFLSCEPLLAPVDLRAVWTRCPVHDFPSGFCVGPCADRQRISWAIIGGESGPNARRFDISWARDIVKQCKGAGVPALVKQLGARPTCDGCAGPDEHWPKGTAKQDRGLGYWEIQLRDRKGGDMDEWPEDLRVREFPQRERE